MGVSPGPLAAGHGLWRTHHALWGLVVAAGELLGDCGGFVVLVDGSSGLVAAAYGPWRPPCAF